MRIYEINARVHCQSFDSVTDAELKELSRLGFDTVWLMGVWRISEGARRISKIVAEDFEGSPYAVPVYKINRSLGGKSRFLAFVDRAHAAGLSVIVDFVSNHMAIDSPWIEEQPDFFIRSNSRARAQATGEYFLHPSGEVVAFGRDPYFPPWHDTAQLDYTNEKLRSRMIEVLKKIGRIADGVRCDMAMLVLRDYVRRQWYAYVPDSWFDRKMPGEFWDQAISEVKAIRQDFTFIAEAYWDKEEQMADLGFDFTYEKKLYDALVGRNAQQVNERLARDTSALRSSLYFIENHDEPRAASVFNRKGNLAAAALILSLPGTSLIHEGQMEGKHERLPVQRIKPLTEEPDDTELAVGYKRILEVTSDAVFREGDFALFDSRVYGAVSFMRSSERRVIAYLGQISDAWHKFNAAPFDISPLARRLNVTGHLRVTNLITSQSLLIEEDGEAFRVAPNRLGVDEETEFCIIEASAG
ncbi:MAG: hypothetical protein L0229_04005 [Blastocatellia bacterium]|nr:hypothetical protein [Blastocatellia bacterium]